MASYIVLLRSFFGHVCLVLAWIVPDHIPPWTTFHHEALMVAAIFLLTSWKKIAIYPPRIIWLTIAFLACVGLQSLTHNLFRDDLAWGFLFAAFCIIAAQQGGQAAAKQAGHESPYYTIRSWLWTILIAGIISALIGLAQWTHTDLGLLMTESTGRAYANLAQPNHLAALLVLAYTALIYLDPSRLPRLFFHFIALLICSTLAITESRTGMVSFALVCLLLMKFGPATGLHTIRRWLPFHVIYFFVFYSCLKWIAPFFGATALRTGIGMGPSGRFEIWSDVVSAIQAHPWLGYGWLQIGAIHRLAPSHLNSQVNIDHAHNLGLDLLAWFGLPLGGMLIIAGCLWCTKVILPTLRKINRESLCYMAICMSIGIHSMLEYPYAYLYFAITAAFFAGTLEATAQPFSFFSARSRILYKTIILISLLTSIWSAYEYFLIEKDYRALRLERQFITQPEQRHEYNSKPALLIQYGNLIASQRKDAMRPEEYQSIEIARQLAQRFPWISTNLHYYFTLENHALCEEAKRQWDIYQSLFGRFGVLLAEEEEAKYKLARPCFTEQSP